MRIMIQAMRPTVYKQSNIKYAKNVNSGKTTFQCLKETEKQIKNAYRETNHRKYIRKKITLTEHLVTSPR